MSCCNYSPCFPASCVSNVVKVINNFKFDGNTIRASLSPGCCTKKFPNNQIGAAVSFCLTYQGCHLCLKIFDSSLNSSTFQFNPWCCSSGTINAYSRRGDKNKTPNNLTWTGCGGNITVIIS